MPRISRTDAQWREMLTDEQYRVLRKKGTEVPFSGMYVTSKDPGTYHCVGCGATLFSSDDKYDSTTPGLIGWPGFAQAVDSGAVLTREDTSHGMTRTEVVCGQCESHLGHLFDDDSSHNGLHYCINSVCLDFRPSKGQDSTT